MRFQTIFLVVLISATLLIGFGTFNAIADPDDDGDDDGYCMGDSGVSSWWGFGMLLMMFGGFLFFVFIIVLLFRDDTFPKHKTNVNALSLLDERYARGEIPSEEYVQMKADMKK